jgi:hypothetical protein
MGSQVDGSTFSRMLCTSLKYFRILNPPRIFFRWTDSSALSCLRSAVAAPRLLAESPERASGLAAPSSSEG